MKATSVSAGRFLIQPNALALVLGLTFTLTGCAYRLPVATLPSQHRLKVAADSPERYVLRLRIREPREYRVPADGRVTLDVPGYRAGCSVYLFDKIRVQRGADPFRAKTIDVIVGGKIVRQLSLKEISALPADVEGYHLLPVRAGR